jgi:hypothetical protein
MTRRFKCLVRKPERAEELERLLPSFVEPTREERPMWGVGMTPS